MGNEIKKYIPSKRIKASHRAHCKEFSPLSLRGFAHPVAGADLAADWFANKKASR